MCQLLSVSLTEAQTGVCEKTHCRGRLRPGLVSVLFHQGLLRSTSHRITGSRVGTSRGSNDAFGTGLVGCTHLHPSACLLCCLCHPGLKEKQRKSRRAFEFLPTTSLLLRNSSRAPIFSVRIQEVRVVETVTKMGHHGRLPQELGGLRVGPERIRAPQVRKVARCHLSRKWHSGSQASEAGNIVMHPKAN